MNILKKYKFILQGLKCTNCAGKIEQTLLKEKDISNFPRNQYLRKNEIIIYFDPRIWKIITLKNYRKYPWLPSP